MVRFDKTQVGTNPLTGLSENVVFSAYLVIDEPEYGITDSEIEAFAQGLFAWCTEANLLKVLSNEH